MFLLGAHMVSMDKSVLKITPKLQNLLNLPFSFAPAVERGWAMKATTLSISGLA
jgi:hypothetical protein